MSHIDLALGFNRLQVDLFFENAYLCGKYKAVPQDVGPKCYFPCPLCLSVLRGSDITVEAAHQPAGATWRPLHTPVRLGMETAGLGCA